LSRRLSFRRLLWVYWRREAVSQLLWSHQDCEVWFFLEKNHEKVYRSPDFLQRGTSSEKRCAAFFAESRMQFGGLAKIHRKSVFGQHQLRNCFGGQGSLEGIFPELSSTVSSRKCKKPGQLPGLLDRFLCYPLLRKRMDRRQRIICDRLSRLRLLRVWRRQGRRRATGAADGRIVRVVGAKAQTDQCPAIRHQFGLPAVVRLVLPHRHLGLCVPLPARSAGEVFLLDQCILNFGGPIGINGPLSVDMADLFPGGLLGRSRPRMAGRGCTMSSACKCWSDSQTGE
jgi:hypothetical protein